MAYGDKRILGFVAAALIAPVAVFAQTGQTPHPSSTQVAQPASPSGSPLVVPTVPLTQPNEPMEAPLGVDQVAPPPVAAPNAVAPDAKPLLVIRFNQKHVYFEHTLQEAVTSAEQAKSPVTYTVVSEVPSSTDREQNGRISEEASDNLQAVVTQLQNMGVPASRIASSVKPAPVDAQEIQIFVQ